jgi:galactose mutarotase-like enzyme
MAGQPTVLATADAAIARRAPRDGVTGGLVGGGAEVVERRFQRTPAIELRSGAASATFVPSVGMTGVSLRRHGREHLALPGGLHALRSGHTGGLPLLAPWANRLRPREGRYRAAGTTVDLTGLPLHRDEHGLPIHGLLVGWPAWDVTRATAVRGVARLRASTVVDAPAFPFPHRLDLVVSLADGRLTLDTTIVPTARRRVPVAIGWHPYLRLPSSPRPRWILRLPARRHLALDDDGIPTGESTPLDSDRARIGTRTFDDLYALGRDRRLSLNTDDGTALEVRGDQHHPYAQVWVPQGRPFAALEPMTVPTNALASGAAPLVAPGEAWTGRWTLTVT